MNRRGLGLAEILIALALFGMLLVTFLRFQQMASKSQGNMEQVNESISLDTTTHQLLLNPAACKLNAQNLGNWSNSSWANNPQNLTNRTIVDNNNTPIVFVGKRFTNGLTVTQVDATKSAPDGNVYLIHYTVGLAKSAGGGSVTSPSNPQAALGKQTYTYDYYINVGIFGAAPIQCTLTDPKEIKLMGVDAVAPQAHASGKPVNLMVNTIAKNYPPTPYPWGNSCCQNIDVTSMMTANCTSTPTGTCPGHNGPFTGTITALGNRMELDTTGSLGVAALADMSGTSATNPNYGKAFASFGGSVYIEVQDASAPSAPSVYYGLGNQSFGTAGNPGHVGGAVTAAAQWVSVTINHNYRFRLIGKVGYNGFSPSDAYSAGYSDATINIRHYMVSP